MREAFPAALAAFSPVHCSLPSPRSSRIVRWYWLWPAPAVRASQFRAPEAQSARHSRHSIRLDRHPQSLPRELPIGLMAAMVMLYFRLDNILIYKFVGSAALGLYAAGFRIVEPALMVPHAFSISLFTILSSRFERRSRRAPHRASASLRAMWPAYLFHSVRCRSAGFAADRSCCVISEPLCWRVSGAARFSPSCCFSERLTSRLLPCSTRRREVFAAVAKITATTLLVNIHRSRCC